MPSGVYKDRCVSLIFPSNQERARWLAMASSAGTTLSKYIIEMARTGQKSLESRSTPSEAADVFDLRRENLQIHEQLDDTRKLLQRAETELFKLRHSASLQYGEFEYSKELVAILQGGHGVNSQELLARLKVDPRDVIAVQIVHKHLQLFKSMGLVEEKHQKWRWTGR
jgi:hypothetical protein